MDGDNPSEPDEQDIEQKTIHNRNDHNSEINEAPTQTTEELDNQATEPLSHIGEPLIHQAMTAYEPEANSYDNEDPFGIELDEFRRTIQHHLLPPVRMNWTNNHMNESRVTINAYANDRHHNHPHTEEHTEDYIIFTNNRSLYSISEESHVDNTRVMRSFPPNSTSTSFTYAVGPVYLARVNNIDEDTSEEHNDTINVPQPSRHHYHHEINPDLDDEIHRGMQLLEEFHYNDPLGRNIQPGGWPDNRIANNRRPNNVIINNINHDAHDNIEEDLELVHFRLRHFYRPRAVNNHRANAGNNHRVPPVIPGMVNGYSMHNFWDAILNEVAREFINRSQDQNNPNNPDEQEPGPSGRNGNPSNPN